MADEILRPGDEPIQLGHEGRMVRIVTGQENRGQEGKVQPQSQGPIKPPQGASGTSPPQGKKT